MKDWKAPLRLVLIRVDSWFVLNYMWVRLCPYRRVRPRSAKMGASQLVGRLCFRQTALLIMEVTHVAMVVSDDDGCGDDVVRRSK